MLARIKYLCSGGRQVAEKVAEKVAVGALVRLEDYAKSALSVVMWPMERTSSVSTVTWPSTLVQRQRRTR